MKLQKTVITCAITGAGTKPEQTPYLPITPEQIANSALEAAEAGATVAHIHVRNIENGTPSMSLDLYRDVVNQIKLKNSQLIINLTTGPGALFVPNFENLSTPDKRTRLFSAEERVRHIEVIKPDICSLDFNTMNTESIGVRINHMQICKEMLHRIQHAGTKPELEIFDSGDFRIALEMLNDGSIKKPALWQFAMGIKYGWDATPSALQYAHSLLPANSIWSAFGIAQAEMPMVALTALHGGHVRVGMEDNIYIEKGTLAKTNSELVKKAAQIIKDIGCTVATQSESRKLLGLNN
ncbi:MAG: 3-keto-5-aminohexanoate cleavage protein [Pseudobdellovibrio sp.]